MLYNSSPSARNSLSWFATRPWKCVSVAQGTSFSPLSTSVPVFYHLLDFTDCLLNLQNFPRQGKLYCPALLSVSSFQYQPPALPGNNNTQNCLKASSFTCFPKCLCVLSSGGHLKLCQTWKPVVWNSSEIG